MVLNRQTPQRQPTDAAGLIRVRSLSSSRRDGWTIRALTLTVLLAALVLAIGPVQSQEEQRVYTIALYAPDINFGGAMSKASFVNAVAAGLSSRTGLTFKGKSFGRAGDFKGAGGVDYAIIGGSYFAVAGVGKPVAFATGSGSMSVIGRGGGPIHSLRGKTLILPQPAKACEGFVSSTLLGYQAQAGEFFKIQTTKDVASALAAVKVGKADLTVGFDAYAGGLPVLFRSNASPLPVATQVNPNIDPQVAEQIKSAWRGLSVSGGGIIRGFGGPASGVKAFRGLSGGKPKARAPSMAPPRPPQISFPVIPSEGLDRLSGSSDGSVISTPPMLEEDL